MVENASSDSLSTQGLLHHPPPRPYVRSGLGGRGNYHKPNSKRDAPSLPRASISGACAHGCANCGQRVVEGTAHHHPPQQQQHKPSVTPSHAPSNHSATGPPPPLTPPLMPSSPSAGASQELSQSIAMPVPVDDPSSLPQMPGPPPQRDLPTPPSASSTEINAHAASMASFQQARNNLSTNSSAVSTSQHISPTSPTSLGGDRRSASTSATSNHSDVPLGAAEVLGNKFKSMFKGVRA